VAKGSQRSRMSGVRTVAVTWQRIKEAFGSRGFALDLDRACYGGSAREPAQSQFDELFESENAFQKYFDAIRSIENAIPVIRDGADGLAQIKGQLAHIEKIDRGCVVHIQYGRPELWVEFLREIFENTEDVSIFINAGWNPSILVRELWISGIISTITEMNPATEIVVSGSSFPDSFSDIGKRGENLILERVLYANLVRRHNAATLIYGDWGSARPPSPPTPMTIVPRLDVPMSSEWVSFRRSGAEEYSDIAERIMADAVWAKSPDIWGKYAIEATAGELPGAVKNPESASAVRINLHLHRQAQFGGPGAEMGDIEEPYTDDL